MSPTSKAAMSSTPRRCSNPTKPGSTPSGKLTVESLDPPLGSKLASPTSVAVGDSSDDIAVGLSDPANTRNRREMLELVNRLRDTGVQTDIDLPMIAVIGNQSAGKSSLIESISGITLPRSSGTCTRCPTECKLSRSDLPWTCTVKLHFSTNAQGVPVPVRLVSFGTPITTKSLVEDRIRRAQRAILNPSLKDPKKYLDEDSVFSHENEVSFSKNYISLEISGRDLADLSFVDLPGLIASVGRGGNETDIELVKSLVTSYIEKPSCVILLTVACETDFENQGAYHLAKSFDPHGKRTVGVLTKPDRIPSGDEFTWLRIIRNETEPLVNNWYCVKQPSSQALSQGVTWADARRLENEFFTLTQPWCSLESQYQNCLRTSNLTEKLSVILSELIIKRLPEIQDELVNTIQETEMRMNELPRAPSNDPVGEVLHALNLFSHDLSRHVEGTPGDGLLQTIHPYQQAFRRAIRSTVPNYIPSEKNKRKKSFSKPEFLANEGDDSEGEGDQLSDGEPEATHPNVMKPHARSAVESKTQPPAKRIRIDDNNIYIDEVLKRAQGARTRELPDNYPFIVQQAYIKEFTKKWEQPAMDLFEKVYTILKADLGKLVEEHFAHMGKGTAKQSVLMIVSDHLDEAAMRTKSKIKWLLDVEQVPTTLNTHYFSDYKDKFLAHYKACRHDSDLLPKLKRTETIPSSPSWSRLPTSGEQETYRNAVNKALSALNEIGIQAKATDLPKLLPLDPMEAALDIMASVRAYFQVAYKRFADMVPMAIDHEIVLGLQKGMDEALREGLRITGPDGYVRCKSMVEEFSSVAATRQEIQKKLERLCAARQELKRLM